ncbi:MAG: BREX-1 system adenine-specific DNA-methyltransferase PglX [Butyrivibrio sp.]|nr:BREX-1 system adenine-specific DNA-methyltransferase PglX [Butyrivibrio sp.]
MNKNAIKKFAIDARNKLIASVTDKAGMLGITPDNCSEAITKGADFEVYKTAAGTEVTLNKKQCEQRRKLVDQIQARGFEAVVEEVAYTWFNRTCAIRFMEVNDYMYPVRVRVLSSEKEGKNEPDVVTMAPDIDWDFTDKEREEIIDAKMNNRLDDLFRMLFIKQCNLLHEVLPGLFEETEDYTEMLLNISFTNEDDVIRMLIDEKRGIPEEDFNVNTIGEDGQPTGQVEIIGWLYQYYNTELKDDTFAKLKKNVKITKERIPAATQLFTPDWIVRYMVENSVGRIWIEHLRAVDQSTDEKATAEKFGWKYYLPEAEQEEAVNVKLAEIRTIYKDLKPIDITCIDLCMGSGHILIAMFDVLMDIYESAGYDKREAAFDIVEHNIHGLDIDKRAYQLAYFAVMMKGRGYNRRFLRGRDGKPEPKVYAIVESNEINRNHLQFFGTHLSEKERNLATMQIEGLINTFKDAREYGSILNVDACAWDVLVRFVDDLDTTGQISFESVGSDETQEQLKKLIRVAQNLGQKYDAVVTNPPYMGAAGMNSQLYNFVKEEYSDEKSDMSTVCMTKALTLCKEKGYMSMINIPVWMFIASYSKLRMKIINNNTIIQMLHLGRGIFGSDFGTTCFVIGKKYFDNYIGKYQRLFEKQGAVDSITTKRSWFLDGNNIFTSKQLSFTKIPGSPIAYWVSEQFINNFAGELVQNTHFSGGRNKTHGNEKYTRMWWEIANREKWQLYVKGGDFRRWYGNQEVVIDWSEQAKSEYASHGGLYNQDYVNKSGICWTLITSAKTAFRYKIPEAHYDSGSPTIFNKNFTLDLTLLGFLNSNIATEYLQLLNPTINMGNTYVLSLPYLNVGKYKEEIENLVKENIDNAKEDWDSFENSMQFMLHPFVKFKKENDKIENCFLIWKQYTDQNFKKMKQSECKLNEIFAKVYGLSNEINIQVPDRDISVRKANLKREIKSFVSYVVGCMFGRYSLDSEGLVYAGGEWDERKYLTYIPDWDNCIPITDEEYFTDDIVERFVEFVKTVYGADTLEENLDFIANTLGNKGDTSREVIRNYFLKDFYEDHLKVYQKRPIYWLFDSGKQNGFKALIYMHRYGADTVGRVRTDYLHKAQKYVETAMQSAQYTIDNATSASEKSKATKAVTKYTKQLAEMKIYDEAIAHVANQRIEIDLDDGVKVNYAKFQGVEVSQEGKKSLKVDLLAKI